MNGNYVYILTNTHHTTLYVGVTSQLNIRTKKHRDKFFPKSFSARYNLTKLVYFEKHQTITQAIAREKQLKAGPRRIKIGLINSLNPQWLDLGNTL